MATGLEVAASNIANVLQTLAPIIALILVLAGGITYGLAQTQPGETRGKWQTLAIGMIVGGIIVMAITGAASLITESSANLLKPV
jgi:predicted exporter